MESDVNRSTGMDRHYRRKVFLVTSLLVFASNYDGARLLSASATTNHSRVSAVKRKIVKGKLAVQVVSQRPNLKRELGGYLVGNAKSLQHLLKTKKRYGQSKSYDFVPDTWYAKTITTIRAIRNKKRKRKRRHKRGAKINNDPVFISEFPTNTRYYIMTNKLRLYIRVLLDGTIDGTHDNKDPHIRLVFESHGPSVLRIKGAIAQRYLTMNKRGVPTAEKNPILWNSLFRINQEENGYVTFASFKFYFDGKYDMLIGITKDGRVKKPWKAAPGQDSTQFITNNCCEV